jgi:two-component system chemotaxis sensor kinase CheA
MNPHPKRVLCVDDDEDTCTLLTSLLGLISCEAVQAGTFEEGKQKIAEGPYDLYLLDNWLPGGTGVELCRLIREGDRTTPVIFYSGAAYESDRREAMEAGAHAYLVKPGDISKLIETVKRFLQNP